MRRHPIGQGTKVFILLMFELEVTNLERPLSLDRTVEFWLIVLFFSNDHQVGSQSDTYFWKDGCSASWFATTTIDLHHADVPPGPGRSGWGFRVPSRYVVGTGKPKWSQWTCGLHHRWWFKSRFGFEVHWSFRQRFRTQRAETWNGQWKSTSTWEEWWPAGAAVPTSSSKEEMFFQLRWWPPVEEEGQEVMMCKYPKSANSMGEGEKKLNEYGSSQLCHHGNSDDAVIF